MLTSLLQVALGGALGASARFLTVSAVTRIAPDFPFGTMTVNVLGSFVMGVVAALAAQHEGVKALSPLLMTGVLGGFTTFSAYSLDAMKLIEAGRLMAGAAYISGSVLLSLMALAIGLLLTRGALA